MYLLFQLKSHAYMYESTPQHIIDEESAPGPVAQWMESSDDDSSSSSSSDSDGSSGSNTTAKRFRRVMRGGRRRRKSTASSKETADLDSTRPPSLGTSSLTPVDHHGDESQPTFGHRLGAIEFPEDGEDEHINRRSRKNSYNSYAMSKKERKKEKERKRQEKKHKKHRRNGDDTITEGVADSASNEKAAQGIDAPRRVDFAVVDEEAQTEGVVDPVTKRPFNIRNIVRPQMPKTFTQNVFSQASPQLEPAPSTGSVPRVKYGIRRTNSLPDRLNQTFSSPAPPTLRIQPMHVSSLAITANKEAKEDEENISRTTAIFLLLISTGLVAVCAEFMVDSINAVVSGNSGLSEAFIGLIILPIVGNAAEHVTAVTVASKNKMDLAIGVAVGSSIQIGMSLSPSHQPH
jgi:Ca2+:H+ antiporter